MSQQGDRHAATEDDWWSKLYEDAPDATTDTGPATGGDTLDDRFDSAADTVSGASATPEDPPPPARDDIPAQRTRAPWEPPQGDAEATPGGWGFTQRFGAPPV
ncbi:hypothetical protein J0695_06610, partial [Streptomyces beijiangensis]|nr:hypothetical protein [Streptomyces beijiangensis]